MYDSTFSSHTNKVRARELVKSYLPSTPGYIATLPCLNFDLERTAIKMGHYVHTIESDRSTYYRQVELCRDMKGVTNYNETALDFFSHRPQNKYEFVYLDFCSQWSRPIASTLAWMSAPVVAVTLLMQRERSPIFKQMDRNDAYKVLFNTLGYEIVDRYAYIGGIQSSMCTFILNKLDHEKK